jgi:tRNA (mo5U34)-methyltransferase
VSAKLAAWNRRRRLEREIESVPYWYHSIDLGGVVTPGRKSPAQHQLELGALQLPDLTGKTVLDVGAWDGYYSFLAEQRGARRVVALDRYVWNEDLNRLAPPERRARYPHPSPGRRGFDIARAALGSSVEPVVMEVDEIGPEVLGTFDVVLFLGVVYHLRHPLADLERVASVTDELLIVETHLTYVAGLEDRALWEFYEADELEGDPTNWWGPNTKGLLAVLRSAGDFRRVELVGSWGPEPDPGRPGVQHRRGVAHAYR